MPVVRLGNSSAHQHVTRTNENGEAETVKEPIPGNQVTTVNIPDSYTRQEAVRTVWHPDGVWAHHSSAPAPNWVESDDPELATVLGMIYGCPVGRPAEWEGQE